MIVMLLVRKYKDYYHGTIEGHQEINLQRRLKKVLLNDLMLLLKEKLGAAMPKEVEVKINEFKRRSLT